ncbi:hypothetical protein M408DRAFT_28597 [Serendipita vermifera MAFF 305830]|uniref:Uncharacterized protein n=1 Tax=Serendipita vermifera MAFF 305830 TaxID=933852 RepID=A0A0C3ARG5_SERVB|nr:hypothetical protein M408DRAFT_28597 [Serendipita vermifera MAFF 305830]
MVSHDSIKPPAVSSFNVPTSPDIKDAAMLNVCNMGLGKETTLLDAMCTNAPNPSMKQAIWQSTRTDTYESTLQPQAHCLLQDTPLRSPATTISHSWSYGNLPCFLDSSLSAGLMLYPVIPHLKPSTSPLSADSVADIAQHTPWEESNSYLQQQLSSSSDSWHQNSLLNSEIRQPYSSMNSLPFPASQDAALYPLPTIQTPNKECIQIFGTFTGLSSQVDPNENIPKRQTPLSTQLRPFGRNFGDMSFSRSSLLLDGQILYPEISGPSFSDLPFGTDPVPDTLPCISWEGSHVHLQQPLNSSKTSWHNKSPLNSEIRKPYGPMDNLHFPTWLDAPLHPSLEIEALRKGGNQAPSTPFICVKRSCDEGADFFTGDCRVYEGCRSPCTPIVSATFLSPSRKDLTVGEPHNNSLVASNWVESTPPFNIGSTIEATRPTSESPINALNTNTLLETTSITGLTFDNAARTRFLELITASPFLSVNELEPTLASEEGRNMVEMISSLSGYNHISTRRSNESIYTVLVDIPTRRCLLCGSSKTTLNRAAIRLWRFIVQMSFMPQKIAAPTLFVISITG